METKDQKPSENQPRAVADLDRHDDNDNQDAAQVSRRRALILGLTAAPAVLSLMNRSAWAQAEVSCTLVASYVNAGYQWQSPRPANINGTLTITDADYDRCNLPKPPPG